jgi:hypothetical protein
MNGGRRWRRRRASSVTDWLDLLSTEGPFLAAPVAREAWPNGLPALEREAVLPLREMSARFDASPGARDQFVHSVLQDFLGWGDRLVLGRDIPPGLVTPVPEHAVEVRPDFVLAGGDGVKAALLGLITPPGTRATARTVNARGTSTWAASPADRLAHALRVQGVPLGLVTDGAEWTLVALARGAVTTATWDRHVWLEDLETLKAFDALLSRQRFFGVEAERTLPALLEQSLDRQEEVTERLKQQSQAVVDMLVATIGRADVDSRLRTGAGAVPEEVEPTEVYSACVTVLMRMVFLLYAEELGLLPVDEPAYAAAYAAGTLAAELREWATEHGEDELERSRTGWYRLLAASRAVHRGARHHDLVLPAYGGSLFDPDRFPWLEGRSAADDPLDSATPLPLDDRTLLHSLEALQTLRFGKERRRISFRQLDVEQIGYVYEGLISQDAKRSDDWVLGVAGDSAGERDGPELALTEMELKLEDGPDEFAAWLSPLTKTSAGGRSEKAILKDLLREADDRLWREVLEACGGNEPAARAIRPFGPLLRRDPRQLPVVYPPNSLYLTDSPLQAHTGAVYTPRTLAEQVVEGALAPIVYAPGPLDTEDRASWRVRPPDEILGLRVIDIAAGSGAFLVAATRYLAAKLVESRAIHEGVAAATEKESADVDLEARRAIVDHCIYGVDVNPMAVEMCKLSLWLVTLDRTRPFTFLDDRIVVGDSLLGITAVSQLIDLRMEPDKGRPASRLPGFDADVRQMLAEAAALRGRIAAIPLIDAHAADDKARLLQQSAAVTDRLRRIADALSAASLLGGRDYGLAADFAAALMESSDRRAEELQERVRFALTDRAGRLRVPAHFPLLFPEVFGGDHPGFDAVIGNPPFLGGQKISGVHGSDYRDHLVRQRGRAVRGSADLVAYFLLTAASIARRDSGSVGLIATNTIAQGSTREVGLDQLCKDGWDITGAVKSRRWPTRAVSLEYSIVWASRGHRADGVRVVADDARVSLLTSSLDPAGAVQGQPYRLAANAGLAFQGTIVLGLGFTMTEQDAQTLIARNPRNAEVLFPYLNGNDLNSRPDCSASRWIINFFDWSEDRARTYSDCWTLVEEKVLPERRLLAGRNPTANDRARHWWRYGRRADALYSAITGLDRVIAVTQLSKLLKPAYVKSRQVLDQKLVVFASESPALFALLSSEIHWHWAVQHTATRGAGNAPNYSPTDCFETFPLARDMEELSAAGEHLDHERGAVMRTRQLGLTRVYNLLHDGLVVDNDICTLRDLHVAIDRAVCAAYGWTDIPLDHGYHATRHGIRWTIGPAAQAEILDRLLALNHERHGEEQSSGGGGKPRTRRGRAPRTPSRPARQTELFAQELR